MNTRHTKQGPNEDVFIEHRFPEQLVNLGEVTLNYATTGSADRPALLLVPPQTESWWAYEAAMEALSEDFEVFAVDLRGQGRSTWTPGRYTLDNFGNDLLRFIDETIRRPVIVAGNSSGGVLAAWLAAFAPPKRIRGVLLEDPPMFSSERVPRYGQSIDQAAAGIFRMWSAYLGDQWCVGDYTGYVDAMRNHDNEGFRQMPVPSEPPQNMLEYDPEWARVFFEGTVASSCAHDWMLSQVTGPVMFTHHFRTVDPATGSLIGAVSDLQAEVAVRLMRGNGATVQYVSIPDAQHILHTLDPARYVELLRTWAQSLD